MQCCNTRGRAVFNSAPTDVIDSIGYRSASYVCRAHHLKHSCRNSQSVQTSLLRSQPRVFINLLSYRNLGLHSHSHKHNITNSSSERARAHTPKSSRKENQLRASWQVCASQAASELTCETKRVRTIYKIYLNFGVVCGCCFCNVRAQRQIAQLQVFFLPTVKCLTRSSWVAFD